MISESYSWKLNPCYVSCNFWYELVYLLLTGACIREFEQLAVSVLEECHRAHPEKAIMLVEKKNRRWSGMSCLDMAAEAKDRVSQQD